MKPPMSKGKRPRSDDPPPVIRWAEMTWKDYLRIGLGLAAFLLGVLGLVLPILQGVLFLMVAAILLAPYSRWVQGKRVWLERRFPWVTEKARAVARRCSRVRRNGPTDLDD